MKLFLGLVFSITCFSQSTYRVVVVTGDGQITQAALSDNVKIDFSTSPPVLKATTTLVEDQWTKSCIGPSAKVTSDKVAVIGPSWTVSNYCRFHFNIVPTANVDPLSLQSFASPTTITVADAFVNDEELYVWASVPVVPNIPSRIVVGVKVGTSISCDNNCSIVSQTSPVRMFPPGTVPIAILQVKAGKFVSNLVDDLLSLRQVHVVNGSVIVRRSEGQVWYEISPVIATQQANLATLESKAVQNELLRSAAVDRVLRSTPPTQKEVNELKAQVNILQNAFNKLHSDLPLNFEQFATLKTEVERMYLELININSSGEYILNRIEEVIYHRVQDLVPLEVDKVIKEKGIK